MVEYKRLRGREDERRYRMAAILSHEGMVIEGSRKRLPFILKR
jgi:hypothetical protein